MSVQNIVEEIKKLNALELSELVKEIETTFGVSAAAPVAVAGAAAPAAGGDAAAAEEKSEYKLVLKDAGAQKMQVIKALRVIVPGIGLKEAKTMADNAPETVKEGMKKEEAEQAKKQLEEAGATVELA